MNGRKTGRKLISFILSLVMIIGMVPMSAAAAPATDDSSTSANVSKVLSYAAQMREKNRKDDYTQGKFTWDTEGKKDSWRYFNGLMMDAFLMTGDESNVAYAEAFYDSNIAEDGTLNTKYYEGELDSIEAARGLFDLLDSENTKKYQLAIQYIYTQLEKQTTYEECGGNYLHKQEDDGTPTSSWSDWNIGLDGLYMAEPFLMECANAIDEGKLELTGKDGEAVLSTSIYEAVYNRFKWIAENMKDAGTGLYHHGWNVENSNGNGHFWARGIGWYAMAQVDVIEMMPEGDYRSAMIAQLPAFFDAMLTYQDDDSGMWYNVVNRSSDLDGNRLETSGSAMMAYALMKAYNNGYVSDAKYGEAGLSAFNGIVENKIQGAEGDYKVVDIYQKSGVGTSDEYYCTNPYTDDEAKGTGALIMAATLANTTAASLPDSPDSGDGDTSEPVKDDTTGISVSGTSATAIAVEDKSDDANVKNALADKLKDGFTAYDITLTGYNDGEEATVTMPAPAGANKVYYVSGEGTAEEITGATFEEGKVTFKTNHFSVYAVGAAKTEEGGGDSGDTGELNWKEIPGGTYYERTQSMTTDGEYVILYQNSGASDSGRALHYNSTSDVNGQSVTVSQENGQYTITNIDAETTWYVDDNIRIYCMVDGDNYYLRRNNNNACLTTNEDDAIRNWSFEAGDNNSVYFNTGTRRLRWRGEDFQIRDSGGNENLYLYEKHTSPGGQAALTGTLSYTVKTGSTLTEAQIKEAASVVRRTSQDAAETFPVSWDDVSVSWDNELNIDAVGTYNMAVSYQGVKLGTITVNVQEAVLDPDQPNWGLNPAQEPYPEYPEDGAVRIDKTATGQNFNSTGVVKVELDTAGISVKQGVDVVLVVDVSNSMGWTDNWFKGMTPSQVEDATDSAKIPTGGAENTTDKLDQAMASAQDFATILLEENSEGSATNNSISFVTFAGYDDDNSNETQNSGRRDYIDSVQTVFTGIQDAKTANNVFANTKFTNYSIDGTSVDYTLQIGSTSGRASSGINRGNTNYDYAFAEANAAVTHLKDSYGGADEYAATGRETIVVFMTDGAPSHYNGNRLNGSHADTLYGTNDTYAAVGAYNDGAADNEDTWLEYISKPNEYAETLKSNINSFYAVGFDLNHGGFGNNPAYSWTQEELQPVLEGLAGTNSVNVTLAENGEALQEFYHSLASRIRLAGTNAVVTDTIKSDFTLQASNFGATENPISPTIEVTSYELYTKATAESEEQIGTRTGKSNTLERVTFNEDGTAAYSDQLGSDSILTRGTDGSVTISAKSFTYTKDAASGVETFVWNIGDITDDEVVLSYYAYLKDSMEGERAEGVYDTNEKAILEYVDINGDYAKQEYPVPQVSWGSALTTIEYYLVNEDGQPVNTNGVVIPFANRITVGSSSTRTINWNETLTVNGRGYVPTGYEMFNPNARYTVTANSDGSGSLTIDDEKYITGTQNITTRRVDTDTDNYAATTVAFGVLHVGTPVEKTPLNPDKIVVDYGKAIQADVTTSEAEGSTYEVVGFMQYNASTDVKLTQFSDGTRTFNGDYGQFTIADGKVQYTLNRMLSAVEKIFVVVKVTPAEGETEAYRMLNELDVIPASNVYYETDFANGVFTFETTGAAWKKETVIGDIVADSSQDDGTIGQNLYGYDNSYANDKYQSNAGSWFVTGADAYDPTKTTSEFSFRGTGFDIISRTDTYEGFIRVTVYSDSAKTQVEKRVTVLNKSESQLRLYQIPVVSIEDLAYGTHYVDIEVYGARESMDYPALSSGGQFHFDAVRIYNPINASANASATSDAGIAYKAYVADGEADASIQEVRNMLIAANTFDETADPEDPDTVPGVSFVDRTQQGAELADYKTIGPNNEVYLTVDQYIGFKVQVENGTLPASIDIGAKSADGNPVTLHTTILDADFNLIEDAETTVAIESSTAQFYDLMGESSVEDAFGGNDYIYVLIDNYGDGVLSITDLKIASGSTAASAQIISDRDTVEKATAYVNSIIDKESESVNYDILSADFTVDSIKRNKTATMMVTTSEAVESLTVRNVAGREVNADVTAGTVENGTKTWTVTFKVTSVGNQTFTVTGYGVDGTAGASAEASIKVTVR